MTTEISFRVASTDVAHVRGASVKSDGLSFTYEQSTPSGTLHAVCPGLHDRSACGEPLAALRNWDLPWSETETERCPLCEVIVEGCEAFAATMSSVQLYSSSHPTLDDNINEAALMVAAQAHCGTGEALGRLSIRASATDQALHDVAVDVLDGLVRFDA